MEHLPKTWANILTLVRIAVIPSICWALWMSLWGTALMMFVLASVTDMLDGWCARYLEEETVFGQYVDPIADKVMMISCYGILAFHPSLYILPQWFFYMVCTKEVILFIGSVYVWHRGDHKELTPTWLGKCAMVLQVVLLAWILVVLYGQVWHLYYVTSVIMWLTIAAIGGSFVHYIYRAIQFGGVSSS